MPQFAHSAGGVVLNARGEVFVVQQRDRSWSLPKGKINREEGEDPRDAALREIVEETGLTDLTFIKLLGSYSRYSLSNSGSENTERLKRLTMYLFTTNQEEIRPMDPRIPDARWVEKDQVAAMLSHPRDQEFFTGIIPELNLLLVG